MTRLFQTVDYEATLDATVRLRDCLPETHLARFVADLVAQLDLSAFYARYGSRGGPPYAPEVLLSLLFYGYATGVFSSRKIAAATYDQVAFRFLAGQTHPDHDTLAHFRVTFLDRLPDVFSQLLLLAQAAGVVRLGMVSFDGTKLHADASKSKAVSYQRLLELEGRIRAEVDELLARAAQADTRPLPDGLVLTRGTRRSRRPPGPAGDRQSGAGGPGARTRCGVPGGVRGQSPRTRRADAAAGRQTPWPRPQAAGHERSPGQRPIQLHRPRQPDHEELHERRV